MVGVTSQVLINCDTTACAHVPLLWCSICKWVQHVSRLDQVDSYYVSYGLLVCLCDSMSCVWNLFVREGCGISCRRAPWGLQICFPCHSSLTATKNTFSVSERTPPHNLHLFLCTSQVWYLSGWVCYLQLEKAKERQDREGGEVTEEDTEEWKALKEAARSYLTSAKKVIQVQAAHKPNDCCFLWYRYSCGSFLQYCMASG